MALIVYTEGKRSADTILAKQTAGMKESRKVLTAMRDLAYEMRTAITGEADLDGFAKLLDEGWQLKRSLGFGITDSKIDEGYRTAIRAGAKGGKLLGAGGGGFLLLLAPRERHAAIRSALGDPRELPFKIDHHGSRIIFISEEQ
jgi:D-glycero-alpha-D-manno-heptose-7-phosphate kinase